MKRKLFALLLLAIFWVVYFFIARLVFLVINHKEALDAGLVNLAGTFTHGIRLDLSATGYILAVPMLIACFSIWIRGEWFRHFIRIYTWILLLFATSLVVGDGVLYTYWGFRMDYTPLLYLKTPQDAAASVSTTEILIVVLTVISLTVLFGYIYKRFIDRMFSDKEIVRYRVLSTTALVLLFGSLIIPVRGGFDVAPINAGSVYFSDNMFVNHAAINVTWNVGASWFNRKPSENPYSFGDLSNALAVRDSLTVKNGTIETVIDNERPNILLIILESFGSALIGELGGDSLTTPNFNRLCKEGVLFSNFYSSGNRTDKALPAILNGFPAQPAVSIIKDPKKTQSMISMVKILNGAGYRSSFWYGGDINFANIHSFVVSMGYHQIITKQNFNSSDYNSKWGVHDHVLFGALKDSMASIKEPFFRTVLTLSSHEPFDVPMKPVFKGNDNLTKFKNSVFYTDSTVGSFISWAKTTGWWKNTLVIFVADHCRRNSTEELVYSQNIFRIPMLWLGGTLIKRGERVKKLGTQVDIPVTLLNQLNLNDDFPYAKDLLSDQSKSFAFYTFNEGFAFITDSSAVIYDHKLGGSVLMEGINPERSEKIGKAYLQVLYEDYMKR